MSDSAEEIGDCAFSGCNAGGQHGVALFLRNATKIGSSIVNYSSTLNSYRQYSETGFQKIYLKDGTITIDHNAFLGCYGESVYDQYNSHYYYPFYIYFKKNTVLPDGKPWGAGRNGDGYGILYYQ